MNSNQKGSITFVTIISLVIIFFGCTSPNVKEVETTLQPYIPTSTASQTAAPTITVTLRPTFTPEPTKTSTPTLTNTPTFTPTWTPLPTIATSDLQDYILSLYAEETCRLPCWWGITPGETTWQAAERVLARFSKVIAKQSPLNENIKVGFADIDIQHPQMITNIYIIDDGVIANAEVPLDFDTYTLSSFLDEYGSPTEIWLSTYKTEYPAGVLPFIMYLFYPDQGILASFGPQQTSLTTNSVKGCKLDSSINYLRLWSPGNSNLSFKEVGDIFEMKLWNEKHLQIEEATGMSVAEFYELFKKAGNPTCLVTQKELWDEQQ